MKRLTATMLFFAVLVGVAAPAMAGGSAPGLPTNAVIARSPKIDAVIVIDPHETTTTTTAKQGSIWLKTPQNPKGREARANFTAPLAFSLALGCDLTLTDARFLNRALEDFIDHYTLVQLFGTLGIVIANDAPFTIPVITQIVSAKCAPVPAANPDSLAVNPGYLIVEAVVQLAVSP